MASTSTATRPAPDVPAQSAFAHKTRAPRKRRASTRGDVPGAMLLIAPLAIFMAVFFITPIVSPMT